jgi:U32 family peptidase
MTNASPHPAPELLAPAGDWDALRAACANGADAVYFGLTTFNARHRAANFTPEDLPKVLGFLHARNVRGFVTLNTLIFSDELEDVAAYIRLISEAGADAVIVQDLGLAGLIARMAPDLHVHASTQMTLTEPRGVEWARERLSIRRAVLARELSVADIQKVAEHTSVPLEVFVHGALCVAYSGQCLTSEALGGRSANRGQCAQACRLPYEMVVDGQVRDLGDRAYLLSPQDLAAHEFVGVLTDAGVISFKIEGRLKGAPYVAATTKAYRDAIDATAARRPFVLPAEQARELQQTFSRGFTPGFLEGPNHQRLVAGRFPKSRGICVGKVVGVSRQGVRVELADADASTLAAGDGVVFDLGRPEDKEPGGRVWQVRPQSTSGKARVELDFESGALDLSAIPVGARVWKTDDPAMKRRLEHTFVGDPIARRAPVSMTMEGQVGSRLRLTVRDADGHEASAEWPGPLEQALKPQADTLREQLDRLGDTPFELAAVESRLPKNTMLPRSVLNNLRRQAVASLVRQRQTRSQVAVVHADALAELRSDVHTRASSSSLHTPHSELTVLVRTLEQLDAVLPYKPVMVYCDFEDGRRYKEAVPRARAAGVAIGLATLRILKPGEEGFLKPLLQAAPDAVLIRNLASMLYFREHAPQFEQIADFSMNVANELTADLLMREGFARLVPSYDLSWDQFTALVRRSTPHWYEPVIHQHMPMFHMEHCVFAAFLSNGKDWRDCGRPCDHHKIELRDRVGAAFPVTPDAGCRNTVFNSVPQSAAEYVPQMLALGLRRFRIELLRETAEQVGPLVEAYRRVIAGADDGRDTWRKLRAMNQLGVTRGTLQLV